MKNCFKPYTPGEPAIDLQYRLIWRLLSGLCVEQLRSHSIRSVAAQRPLHDPWQPSQVNAAIFAELRHLYVRVSDRSWIR